MTANTGEPDTTAPVTPRRGRVPADTLGNRLVLARKLEGVSIEDAVEQVYERTGVRLSKSSWANWEQGRRPQGETDVLGAIADGLDIDEHWLMFGGPLEGPRGRPIRRPAKRAGEDRFAYPRVAVRPPADRPKTRGEDRSSTVHSGGSRRANRVTATQLAEAVQRNVMRR